MPSIWSPKFRTEAMIFIANCVYELAFTRSIFLKPMLLIACVKYCACSIIWKCVSAQNASVSVENTCSKYRPIISQATGITTEYM